MLEPTPEPQKKPCRIAALLLGWFLSYGTFFFGIAAWVLYGWFYAIAALLLAFVVLGILRAKIRNASIPLQQQEYQYTDQAIAKWFVVRRMLCDL